MPTGKGSRLIIFQDGSAQQVFIKEAQLVFQSKCWVDYHKEMNRKVFREWFINILRGLDEPVVMDNARRKL